MEAYRNKDRRHRLLNYGVAPQLFNSTPFKDFGAVHKELYEHCRPESSSLPPQNHKVTVSISGDSANKIGLRFHENTMGGIHALFTLPGTTLPEIRKQPGKPTLVIKRKFITDHVVVKVQIDDITSLIVYDTF